VSVRGAQRAQRAQFAAPRRPRRHSGRGAALHGAISAAMLARGGRVATKKKATAKTKTPAKKPRIYTYSFGSVYPLYVQKVEAKGRTRAELDDVITWLTGYTRAQMERVIRDKVDLEHFFADAPKMNANAKLIIGVVCGVRVEELIDPLMKKIRWMDKLVDELAKGKKMETILR
jgi:hypothetical protein